MNRNTYAAFNDLIPPVFIDLIPLYYSILVNLLCITLFEVDQLLFERYKHIGFQINSPHLFHDLCNCNTSCSKVLPFISHYIG